LEVTSLYWKRKKLPPEINQGKRVVLDLTEGLSGHNITCDNFFTSKKKIDRGWDDQKR